MAETNYIEKMLGLLIGSWHFRQRRGDRTLAMARMRWVVKADREQAPAWRWVQKRKGWATGLRYLDNWSHDWGLSRDAIRRACLPKYRWERRT